jgi:hypothetical protein
MQEASFGDKYMPHNMCTYNLIGMLCVTTEAGPMTLQDKPTHSHMYDMHVL